MEKQGRIEPQQNPVYKDCMLYDPVSHSHSGKGKTVVTSYRWLGWGLRSGQDKGILWCDGISV